MSIDQQASEDVPSSAGLDDLTMLILKVDK